MQRDFELRTELVPYDNHDAVLANLEGKRGASERSRQDRQIEAWRQAQSVGTE